MTLKVTILFQFRLGKKIKQTRNKLTLEVTLNILNETKINTVYSKQLLSTNITA